MNLVVIRNVYRKFGARELALIGLFTFSAGQGHLQLVFNVVLDQCKRDRCFRLFIYFFDQIKFKSVHCTVLKIILL